MKELRELINQAPQWAVDLFTVIYFVVCIALIGAVDPCAVR